MATEEANPKTVYVVGWPKEEKKKKKNPQNESMATLKQCKIKIRGIESKIVIFNVIVTSHVTSQWCH